MVEVEQIQTKLQQPEGKRHSGLQGKRGVKEGKQAVLHIIKKDPA